MIQKTFNIFIKNGFSKFVPSFYLSQLFKLKIFDNKLLTPFFENNIPAIQIDFNLKDFLKQKDYNTIEAADGEEALKVFEENQRFEKIKFRRLSLNYKESLAYVVQDINKKENMGKIKKAMKD